MHWPHAFTTVSIGGLSTYDESRLLQQLQNRGSCSFFYVTCRNEFYLTFCSIKIFSP